jgi:hypothetical protein
VRFTKKESAIVKRHKSVKKMNEQYNDSKSKTLLSVVNLESAYIAQGFSLIG